MSKFFLFVVCISFFLTSCAKSDVTVVVDSEFSYIFPKNPETYIRAINRQLPEKINLVILTDSAPHYVQRSAVLASKNILTLGSLTARIRNITDEFALEVLPDIYYMSFFQETEREFGVPIAFNRVAAFQEAGNFAAERMLQIREANNDPNVRTAILILDHGEQTRSEISSFQQGFGNVADLTSLSTHSYSEPLVFDDVRNDIFSLSQNAVIALFLGSHNKSVMDSVQLVQDKSIILETFLLDATEGKNIVASIGFSFQDIIKYVILLDNPDVEMEDQDAKTTGENGYVVAQFVRYSE